MLTGGASTPFGLIVLPRKRLEAELMRVEDLPDGWDAQGAVAPRSGAIRDARQFVDLLEQHAPDPEVEPSPDGEVSLVWRDGSRYLEVGFYGEGKQFSYFGRVKSGGVDPVRGDAVLSTSLPPDLDGFLRGFIRGDLFLRAA